MRCVAGVGLLVVAGCNQIFGISETQPWDAPPPMHYATFDWQIAPSAPGAPIAYEAFSAGKAPQIRIALLDGPLVAADYAASPGDGRIKIPASFVVDGPADGPSTWRLEYQFPEIDAVPHEVQWAPADKVGHIVRPIAGRPIRDSVLSGSGFRVTPSNPPAGYTAPRVWTTGIWTDGRASPMGTAIDYDFLAATWLSGDQGRPDPAQGDRAFVLDFVVDTATQCRVAIGGAMLATFDLGTGTHTAQTVAWDPKRVAVASEPVNFGFIQRLADALGKLHGAFNANGSGILYGIAPSLAFPGLTASSPVLPLPVPVMQPLLQCPYNASPLPDAVLPGGLDAFPLVLHAQIIDSRKVGTINLYSGLETVLARSPGGNFVMSFPAAMPTTMTLATPAAASLDLAGDADQVPAGSPTGPFVLGFVPETGLAAPDYYDVVLHRLAGETLTTERIYTVAGPRVRIDPSVLVDGAEYVFEIRSYSGHPLASHGDFTTVKLPYGSAVVFTRTFKTVAPPPQ